MKHDGVEEMRLVPAPVSTVKTNKTTKEMKEMETENTQAEGNEHQANETWRT